MPVSLAFVHRFAKFRCLCFRHTFLQNLLIGKKIIRIDFDVDISVLVKSHAHRAFIVYSLARVFFVFSLTNFSNAGILDIGP